MRILHTADWHLGDRLGRIDRTADIQRAVEQVAEYCESERADVCLVAGDLFSDLNRSDTLRESIEHLAQVFERFLLTGGTILALTGNHDNESFCRTLREVMRLAAPGAGTSDAVFPSGRLYLAATPMLLRLKGRRGDVVQFVLMPFPTAAQYLNAHDQRYGDVVQKHRLLAAAFSARLQDMLFSPPFDPALPTVLGAHVFVRGAVLPQRFRISERDDVVWEDRHALAEFAYVALGHLHRPQSINAMTHACYSGSIERLDLGERQDEKAVLRVDLAPDQRHVEPVMLPLQATPIYEVEIRDPPRQIPALREQYPDAAQALVRLHVHYRPGEHNLQEILEELNQLFPRWYERRWTKIGELQDAPAPSLPVSPQAAVRDTVLDYLRRQLARHRDRDAVIALAEELMVEEEP